MALATGTNIRGYEEFRSQQMYRHPNVAAMNTELEFSEHDTEVLRRLASQVSEIAARKDMEVKKKLWLDNHDRKSDTPVIFVDPENGWNEILTEEVFQCENPLARTWENILRKDILSADFIKDDRVITANFDVPWYYTEGNFGLIPKLEYSDMEGGSYHVSPAIEDYEEDFEKLHFPELNVDYEKSDQIMELAKKTFGGYLKPRRSMKWHWDDSFLMEYVQLRGMEDFMCDFAIEPEWVVKMVNFMIDGVIDRFDQLEKAGLLSLNNDETYLGTGGQGYLSALPGEDYTGPVTTKDMWVTLQAQETVSCNPDQFGEYIVPAFSRLAEKFGYAHYGCCEPFDKRWKWVKKIPNLLHVSVSPWADFSKVPEYLGKDYLASVKLKPTPLAMPGPMNEDVVRADCRKAVEESYGGICEFIMKDNHTIGREPEHLSRWVEIMREEIDRRYQ